MLQGSRHFSLLVSTVWSFFRSNQTFLHSFNQSLPPLPSYRLCPPSLSVSLVLSLSFSSSWSPFFPPTLSIVLQDLQSSFKCTFSFLSLLAPILPAVRLPRSCGSFVSLVISSYGRLCISFRFSSRVLLAQVYLSSSDLMEGFCPVRSGIMGS